MPITNRSPTSFAGGLAFNARDLIPPGATGTTTPAGIREHDPDVISPANEETAQVRLGETTFLCPFEALGRNRFNPRQHFDRAELDELGARLKRDGQVQAILVRKNRGGSAVMSLRGGLPARWEIVAGERRALAAFHAGLPGVRAEVIDACDDARACELAIAENRDRKDISQVEYARGLRKLADLKGLDPAALAADQGLSVEHVRNLFRLLKAPEEWQARVIEGTLSGTHLRHALPFLHVPAIAADLEKIIEDNKEVDGRFARSEKRWRYDIESAVRKRGGKLWRSVVSRDGAHFESGEVKIDPKDSRYAELDVIELPAGWGSAKEKIALNRKLANELLAEKAKRWHEKRGKKKGKAEPTPGELRKCAAEAKKRRRDTLQGFVRYWFSWLCSRAIRESEDQGLCLRIVLAWQLGSDDGMLANHNNALDWALAEIGAPKVRHHHDASPPHLFANLDEPKLQVWSRELAGRLFWPPGDDAPEENLLDPRRWWPQNVDRDQAEWLKILEIDPEAQWRAKGSDGRQLFLGPLTAPWLALHDDAALRELAEAWKVGGTLADKLSREKLIAALIGNEARVMPMPDELVEIVRGAKTPKSKVQDPKSKRKAK